LTTIAPLETIWTVEAVLAVGVTTLVMHLCGRYWRVAKQLKQQQAGLVFQVLVVFLTAFVFLQMVFALAGLRAMNLPAISPTPPGASLVLFGFILAETVMLGVVVWAYLKVLQLRLPSHEADENAFTAE
jgi:hypothetical protein